MSHKATKALCSAKPNRFLLTAILLAGAFLASIILVSARRNDSRLSHNGKSMEYWEKEALIHMGQGSFDSAIFPVAQEMGPEVVPFWLERLETTDSLFKRSYSRLWSSLPSWVRARLPAPISARARRNAAFLVLSHLQFTNGTPELIRLSYSKDTELQCYAVSLLWRRAYNFYEPSTECIDAFCSALKTGDVQTRLWAVRGLNILPLRHEALPTLHSALKDPEEEIRVEAARAIIKLQPDYDLIQLFQAGLASSNSNVRAISRVEISNLQRRQKATPSDRSKAL